jgi:hypothetical protein
MANQNHGTGQGTVLKFFITLQTGRSLFWFSNLSFNISTGLEQDISPLPFYYSDWSHSLPSTYRIFSNLMRTQFLATS